MLSSNLTVEDEEAVQAELRELQREAVSSRYYSLYVLSDHVFRSLEKSPSGRSGFRLRRTTFPSSPFQKRLSRSRNVLQSANESLYPLENRYQTSGGLLFVHMILH